MEAVMSILWMGLAISAVILISFVLVLGITKGVSLMVQANKKNTMYSTWMPLQVYSGDDSLGHPDLDKISALRERELTDGVDSH